MKKQGIVVAFTRLKATSLSMVTMMIEADDIAVWLLRIIP